MNTLFYHARIVTPVDPGTPLRGPGQSRVVTIGRDGEGALLAVQGHIAAVGTEREVRAALAAAGDSDESLQEVDLDGACVVPGFVDPHTHLCFAALREEEFAMRLAGMTYLEILEKGGGILSSVRAVRRASDETLYAVTRRNALRALAQGTTTVEVKSGYGLETGTELRMLAAIARLGRETPLDVVPTFMGAHAVPEEYRGDTDGYVRLLVEEMLPAVARAGLARYCDVFCEVGVFSVEQSRCVLEAARRWGLGLKIHADEVNDLGGAGLAAELGVTSAEHLLAADPANLAAMGQRNVIAVVLPATAYSLRKPYAATRRMIDGGTPVALATDCNPGSCYCESMPFVMNLAVMQMGLSSEEALVGCTLNAAYAVGMADRAGSLELGKQADLLVLEGETPACVAYHAGSNPVRRVYKRGVLVAESGRVCC